MTVLGMAIDPNLVELAKTLIDLDRDGPEFRALGDDLAKKARDVAKAMLAAHRTQLEWLRDHDGVDILDEMRTAARYRGQQCGVRYAEGFRRCLTWLRGTTTRLLP